MVVVLWHRHKRLMRDAPQYMVRLLADAEMRSFALFESSLLQQQQVTRTPQQKHQKEILRDR